jgi:enoyl-CoA hydratase/carnithine racemase
MTEHVKTQIDAGIMTLTVARADNKNALSNAMYSAISDGLERAEKDPAVRVVLFQGDGDSFTADNDSPISVRRPTATTVLAEWHKIHDRRVRRRLSCILRSAAEVSVLRHRGP